MTNPQQSTLVDTVSNERATLTFSIEGLAAREELLFKGYVRLLDHMTEHGWQHHEPSTTKRVDLLVVDEHVEPTKCLSGFDKHQPILQLGVNKNASGPFYLVWPLKPYELEYELNRIGRMIAAGVAHEKFVNEQKAVPMPSEAVVGQTHYRLSQWPKPFLLTLPGRMRLATLLTSKAMGLEELVSRSALSKEVCERFIRDMQAANLMMHPVASSSQQTAPLVSAAHTPDFRPGLSVQLERQANQTVIKPALQHGLLARIRMRFGIKNQLNI